MDLLALARLESPTAEEASLVLAAAPEERNRPALAAALRALAPAESPRVITVEPLPVAGRTAVDLQASLPGGGAVLWSVQTVGLPDGTSRVAWFETPSGSWPVPSTGPGEGLTSSSPPR